MKREKDGFKDSGLVRIGHSLGYGWGHGSLRWLPKWAQRIIVRVWNNVTCEIFGHHILDYRKFEDAEFRLKEPERIVCTMCCKTFTPAQYDKLKKKTW
jgi:hypothetical protein